MDSGSLLARMKQLRERQADTDPCPRSELTNSSPLSLYLSIYTKASRECYIDYSSGAKALLNWLAPAGIPLDYQTDKYPRISDTSYKVPRLCAGYAAGELSKLLVPENKYPDFSDRLAALAEADRAIYLTMKELY